MATVGQAMTPGQVRDQMRARPGFASKTAKALGITQLTCGILSVVFGFAALFTPSMRYFSLSYIGSPIWCGAMVSIIHLIYTTLHRFVLGIPYGLP